MAAIIALLPGIIALIPSITVGVEKIIDLISAIRLAASQTGEWDDATENAWVAALEARAKSAAYQPDPK